MERRIVRFALLAMFCFYLAAEGGPFEDGVKFFNEKNYPKAIEELQKVSDDRNTNLLISYYLGISLYYQKNNKESSSNLKYYLLNVPPEDVQKIRDALTVFFTIQRTERAWEELVQMGNLYAEKIAGRKSFGNLGSLIENNLVSAYSTLGGQSFSRSEYKEAKELYLKALSLNPQNTGVIERVAACDYSLGLYDEAVKNFIVLLESESKNWRLLTSGAYFLNEIRKPDDDFIAGLAGKNPPASGILSGYRYFKKGDYEKAFAAVKKPEEDYKAGGEIVYEMIGRMKESSIDAVRVYLFFIREYPLSTRNEYVVSRILVLSRGGRNESQTRAELTGLIKRKIQECTAAEKLPGLEKLLAIVEFDNPGESEELYRGRLAAFAEIVRKYPESDTTRNIMFEMARIHADRIAP